MAIDVIMVDPITHFDEAASLLAANWAESGTPIDFIAKDAKKFYEFLASKHVLFAAAAFQDSTLVGYAICTVVPHPLNHSAIICNCDGIYLMPGLRGAHIVASMMQAIRQIAYEHKAHSVHWHAAAHSNFATALAKRFIPISNYFREELVYG